MFVARILYPVKNLGPGNRLGIWVSGCNRCCAGCANPELHDRLSGHQISLEALKKIIYMLPVLPEGVTITGGEPFDQTEEISELCEWLNHEVSEDILIYTGYTLRQLTDRNDDNTDRLLSKIAALVDGEYIEHLNKGNHIKGSENQVLHVFRQKYCKRYYALDKCGDGQREVQPFLTHDGSIITTGFESVNFNSDFSDTLQAEINNGGYYEQT